MRLTFCFVCRQFFFLLSWWPSRWTWKVVLNMLNKGYGAALILISYLDLWWVSWYSSLGLGIIVIVDVLLLIFNVCLICSSIYITFIHFFRWDTPVRPGCPGRGLYLAHSSNTVSGPLWTFIKHDYFVFHSLLYLKIKLLIDFLFLLPLPRGEEFIVKGFTIALPLLDDWEGDFLKLKFNTHTNHAIIWLIILWIRTLKLLSTSTLPEVEIDLIKVK